MRTLAKKIFAKNNGGDDRTVSSDSSTVGSFFRSYGASARPATPSSFHRKQSMPLIRLAFASSSQKEAMPDKPTPDRPLPDLPARPRSSLTIERRSGANVTRSSSMSSKASSGRHRERRHRPNTAAGTDYAAVASPGASTPTTSSTWKDTLVSLTKSEEDHRLDDDVEKIATYLCPAPVGFASDAFEERVDLIRGLVRCHLVQEDRMGVQSKALAKAGKVTHKVEMKVERKLRSMLIRGKTDLTIIASLRLPLAFSLARQQCGLSPETQFKLFADAPLKQESSSGPVYYPGLGDVDRLKDKQVPKTPTTPRTLNETHALTPAPRKARKTRRPTTAPPPSRDQENLITPLTIARAGRQSTGNALNLLPAPASPSRTMSSTPSVKADSSTDRTPPSWTKLPHLHVPAPTSASHRQQATAQFSVYHKNQGGSWSTSSSGDTRCATPTHASYAAAAKAQADGKVATVVTPTTPVSTAATDTAVTEPSATVNETSTGESESKDAA